MESLPISHGFGCPAMSQSTYTFGDADFDPGKPGVIAHNRYGL